MSKEKIRAGVIGAGGIAQVSHIPNLKEISECELIAICESDVARMASVADRFGIPEFYDDPEQMLSQADLDFVIITTPTITHLPLCQVAFENGVDVMIEKPFARNLIEAKQINALAKKHKRLVMVGMNHRFREDTAYLKRYFEDDKLGDVFMIHSGWLRRLGVWGRPYWFTNPKLAGGGVLMDLGLQMIDVVLYMLDYPTVVESACGLSNKVLGLEVEDTASVFLKFDTDVSFLLEVSWANCHTADIAFTDFSCTQGGASLNPLRLKHRVKDRIIMENAPVMADAGELYRRSFQAELGHFVNCVKNGVEPFSSGQEALAAIEIVDRLYQGKR